MKVSSYLQVLLLSTNSMPLLIWWKLRLNKFLLKSPSWWWLAGAWRNNGWMTLRLTGSIQRLYCSSWLWGPLLGVCREVLMVSWGNSWGMSKAIKSIYCVRHLNDKNYLFYREHFPRGFFVFYAFVPWGNVFKVHTRINFAHQIWSSSLKTI